LGASLAVFDEASEPSGRCEGSLDDPSPRQQHEAALGLWQLDDLEGNAMFGGRRRRFFPALIDELDLDARACLRLNGLGDPARFGTNVGVGRRDVQSQKMAERIDGQMQFEPFLRFAPS
jgi:hypothetical protein